MKQGNPKQVRGVDMLNLRNLFIIGLVCGFIYTTLETKSSFIELRANRISQIETALAQWQSQKVDR